jgi:hypothetical protein
MRGHWEPAEGTIVDVDASRREPTYTIEAWSSRSLHVRATVKHKSPTIYPVGSKVRIELNEHNQMRFDVNAPGGDPLISTMTMSDQIAEAAAAFDRPGAHAPDFGNATGRPGTVIVSSGAATIRFAGDMPQALAGFVNAIGATNARVIGRDGSEVPVDGDEISQLTQAVLAGDPAARQAAVLRLRQISTNPGGAPDGATAEQRLAALHQLFGKGMLTQSEYESQRQRIIEGI